jgi:hypothetical protein
MDFRRALIQMMLLIGLVGVLPACSATSGAVPAAAYPGESIERPATSLGDEDTPAEKMGKALVAGLVVCVALAAIIVPILLFT